MVGELILNNLVDVFPWDLMIHLCIVVMTTLQILAMVETTGSYSRNKSNFFHMKFLCNDNDANVSTPS